MTEEEGKTATNVFFCSLCVEKSLGREHNAAVPLMLYAHTSYVHPYRVLINQDYPCKPNSFLQYYAFFRAVGRCLQLPA